MRRPRSAGTPSRRRETAARSGETARTGETAAWTMLPVGDSA
jgi:hypothetical protein